MRNIRAIQIALLGAGVVAITYGLARFVFGLFLPPIRDDLGLGAAEAGIIGALPFVSFILAIITAPRLTERLGPRWAGLATLGLAVAGLLLIAASDTGLGLGLGVAVCGVSTGLSSPVLADAVYAGIRPGLRPRVNAIHNAGTSIGVAIATPVSWYWLGEWRSAYLVFAALAAVAAVAAVIGLPQRTATAARAAGHAPYPRVTAAQTRSIMRLSALAAAMGFISSIYWVFAPDAIRNHGGLNASEMAWMWGVVGSAGLIGATAGDLIDRFGSRCTHAAALCAMAIALLLLAGFSHSAALGLLSAAFFGAAYMTLTGLYLVEGVRILGARPALGPVLPFLAVAGGQAIGSPLAGGIIDNAGYIPAFFGFGGIGVLTAGVGFCLMDPRPT